jgi:diguanylate cyclase (GGDEF)-like protein
MRIRFWIGLSAVLLIAAGAAAAALIMHAGDTADFHEMQREEAIRAAHQAEAVAVLSVGQLGAAAASIQTQNDLNSHEFDVLGKSLLDQGVLTGTAFVPQVMADERAAYERRHGFEIVERVPGGGRQRAIERPVYYPVTYVAADANTAPAQGYDLGSDFERAPSLFRAAETGEPAATPAIQLVLGGKGINVFRAVYRDGAPVATPAERRRALIGFVAGSFQTEDLARSAISALEDDSEVQLRVGDETAIGADGELDDAATAPIRIADRTWVLVARDPDRPDISLPLLLAVVGISLAALLGSLIFAWSRNERMEELQREASEDPLTGLKNRRRFDEDLRTAMARSRRERTTGAMLMLDLDHFKDVNDTYGHPAGDRLIVEIAEVLRRRTRESDSLGRLGGDEFAVVLPRCSREEAILTAEAIARAIREHAPVGEHAEPITACVGVAMFGEDARIGAASVASRADAAMYAAKDNGRDGVRIFDPQAIREDQPG